MTPDSPKPETAESAVYRKAFKIGSIVFAVGMVLAGAVGYAVEGTAGMWAGLIGMGIAAVAGLATPLSMQVAHRQSPPVMAAIVMGSFLAKMVLIIVTVLVLSQIDGFPRGVFGAAVMVGIMVMLGIDAVVLMRGRVPYTTNGSNGRDE